MNVITAVLDLTEVDHFAFYAMAMKMMMLRKGETKRIRMESQIFC